MAFVRGVQLTWGLLMLLAVVVGLTACGSAQPASTSPASTSPASTSQALTTSIPTPEWRPRDRWVYEWTSGAETGTKTAELIETKVVNSVSYYVLRFGDAEHYYTADLHWAAAIRESRVEARMLPPAPWFTWPLMAGRRWDHRGVFEDHNGRTNFTDRFAVVGPEPVEVPAGRFQAMKVVRETDRKDSDEYWYAPEARWYVRWLGRRGDVVFEERLKEYHPVPRLIPSAPPKP